MTAEASDQSANILQGVQYAQPGIGHFTHLPSTEILHGFTWGPASENMAYGLHEGDPHEITRRNVNFLRALGMAGLRNTVVIEALIGAPGENKSPVDITESYLSAATTSQRGIFTPSHLVFTALPKQPLAIKPGDCAVSVVYGQTDSAEPVIGIIHASRNELAEELPAIGINHLVDAYGCALPTIQIGIAPSLGREHHLIRAEDVERCVPNIDAWGEHKTIEENGDVHLDAAGFLFAQFAQTGVPRDNIQLYDTDTYTAAEAGVSFSHRYTTMKPSDRVGRYMLAAQIR